MTSLPLSQTVGHRPIWATAHSLWPILPCVSPSLPHLKVSMPMLKSMITAIFHAKIFPGGHHCAWRFVPVLLCLLLPLVATQLRTWKLCVVPLASVSGIFLFQSGETYLCSLKLSGFSMLLLPQIWHWSLRLPVGVGRLRWSIVCALVPCWPLFPLHSLPLMGY